MSLNGDALAGALAALSRGESIVATTTKKRPWFSWKKFQNQHPTEQNLRTWAGDRRAVGFAVVTGQISNLIVFDFDDEHGNALLKRLDLDPHVRTGSGGHHVRLAHPGFYVPTQNSEVTKILQERWHGLDIRADGGLAVEWGSNANGVYKQLRDLTDLTPISAIPTELAVDLRLVEVKKTSYFTNNGTDTKTKKKITHPGRYDHLFKIGCGMRGRGHEEPAILAELRRVNETDCDPPKDDADVVALAHDIADRYKRGGPVGASERRDELLDKLTEATKITLADRRAVDVRMYGRGLAAIVHIELDNGALMEFDRYSQILQPQILSGTVAAYTGVGEVFKQADCAKVAGLVKQISKNKAETGAMELAGDWGLSWLYAVQVLDFNPDEQAEKWGAWQKLHGIDPVQLSQKHDKKDEDPTPRVVSAYCWTLRAPNGTRYVHSAWFYEYVKRDLLITITAGELINRMLSIGWDRKDTSRGRIKATEPGGNGVLWIPFLLVPKGWEAQP